MKKVSNFQKGAYDMLSLWLASLLALLLKPTEIKTKKTSLIVQLIITDSILIKYLPHEIHWTSHSMYGGKTQESFLLSPKVLGVGSLDFSDSDSFLPLIFFFF